MAVLCAREGAKVYGCDIKQAPLRKPEAIVQQEGGTMSVNASDVSHAGRELVKIALKPMATSTFW